MKIHIVRDHTQSFLKIVHIVPQTDMRYHNTLWHSGGTESIDYSGSGCLRDGAIRVSFTLLRNQGPVTIQTNRLGTVLG